MLSASTGLLRKACLQSHSHPLQCRALELCFNVALNRLPASSSSPMMGLHPQHPSISNALVAAFKRAQAHQRRGSIENQQQPVLAVKIEIEQLIVSILDDPSVSRVMREAGFSSTKVKSNVEESISLEICSPESNNQNRENSPCCKNAIIKARNEDVISVMESLMNKRRKGIMVIVGECIESIESVVGEVMQKVEKGDVKFKSLPLSSFANLRREEVEEKIGELISLVRSLLGKGVVLYLGDLQWVVDYRVNNSNCGGDNQGGSHCYCPVEHMIMEVGRLVHRFGENGNFRVMGIATFQSYMRCRSSGHHSSLESVWSLQPVTLPAGNLGLSLTPDCSDNQSDSKSKKAGNNGSCEVVVLGNEEKSELDCCADCSANFEAELRNLRMIRCNTESTSSTLPSWLRNDSKRFNTSDDNQSCTSVKVLSERWNSICNSVHKQSNPSLERALTFPAVATSSSPSSSNSCFSNYDHNYNLRLHLNPNSTSSSETMEIMDYVQKFKIFNSQNLITICDALEKRVPWQKEIIPEIATTILQSRSGMLKRKESLATREDRVKQETWLFFQGQDFQAKELIARELGKIVFGSYSSFESISLSRFSSKNEGYGNKRPRDEEGWSYVERFSEAVARNPHRVFLMEDVEQADSYSQKGIKRAIERGRISSNNGGEEVSLGDAIVILSSERFDSRNRSEREEACSKISLDLNMSFDDERIQNQTIIDDVGLLESVDRLIVFKSHE